ncbi:sporulation protein YpjB [Paenibacillus sp. CF384]|uniref:sporulation protein YpjB n=1 Tax=Paenibacillus sp. CF384 TaxID=1884382 RepID=UPI000897AB77|nr:sporulation protein YpjB [Paenibacillus sp. CF384]SDW29944.1 Sporulation protein YpjB (SpoYpjB) [Paenibacillus sp. CF384]
MRSSTFFALLCSVVIIVLLSGCNLSTYAAGNLAKPASTLEPDSDQKPNAIAQLSALSDQIYTAAYGSNRQLVYTLLQRLETISAAKAVRESGTAAGWAAFDESMALAKDALLQKQASRLWYTQAARLKLAGDALNRPKVPLWLQYEGVLREDEQRIRTAWQMQSEGRAEAASVTLGIYKEHVERFEVAALMQRDEESLRQLKEQMMYAEQVLVGVDGGTASPEAVLIALSGLEHAANQVFKRADGEAAIAEVIPPGTTVGSLRNGRAQIAEMFIAAFVMAILALAGWRKYRQQPNRIPFPRERFK